MFRRLRRGGSAGFGLSLVLVMLAGSTGCTSGSPDPFQVGVPEISVSPSRVELRTGQDTLFRAQVRFIQPDEVRWRSSDATVVEIDASGRARAVAPGASEIIAFALGDTTLRARAQVTVTP